jgi:hypothetical protein
MRRVHRPRNADEAIAQRCEVRRLEDLYCLCAPPRASPMGEHGIIAEVEAQKQTSRLISSVRRGHRRRSRRHHHHRRNHRGPDRRHRHRHRRALHADELR